MLFSTGKYKRLIIKLIQGEATPEEKQQAEAWLKKSPANQRLYETYKGLLVLTESRNVRFDTDKAWSKLHTRMQSGESSAPPAEKKSMRQLLPYYSVAGLAAILLIAFGIFSSLQKAPEMKQISTLTGISAPVDLPDGTTAILNRNTLIKYPGVFSGDTREISIFGEAFFEVSPDRDKPFLIHASGVDIKVVGTSFNVDARPGSDVVRVTVNTGKVVVYPAGTDPMLAEKTGVLLSAGEMATYSPESGKILRGVNDNLNVLSWKTGILTFRESRLDEVLKALENKYQTRLVVSNRELLNQRLTARFENESLQTVMETLSLIFGFQYEIKGSLVLLH